MYSMEDHRMAVDGPIVSDGLGRALRVSLVPAGICTCSCVYCPHGRTNLVPGRRRQFGEREVVLEQILDVCRRAHPDFITFIGGGESTLEHGLGRLIQDTKRLARLPVAVVTNGTLLYRRDVRQDLARADVVISSLDAGTEDLFLGLKRPHGALEFARLQDGLLKLRAEMDGRLWLDVMLVRRMNDGPGALAGIRRVIDRIEPDAVRVKTLFRPPPESFALPTSPQGLARAIHELGPRARAFLRPRALSS